MLVLLEILKLETLAARARVYMQVPEEARRQPWSPWSWSTPVEPSSVDAVLIITELSLQPYISINSEEFSLVKCFLARMK